MLKNLKPCKDTDFGGKVAFAFLLDFVVGTKDDEADEAAFVVIAGMDDTVPIAEQHPMMGRLVLKKHVIYCCPVIKFSKHQARYREVSNFPCS